MAARMAGARDRWWIIAGAAVALHGVDTPVADVDLLTSRHDARRLLGGRAVPGAPSDRYRSGVFGRLVDWPLPVEVMADFDVCSAGIWRRVEFATRKMVAVSDVELPVPDRRELAALLALLDRPKDRARSALLGC